MRRTRRASSTSGCTSTSTSTGASTSTSSTGSGGGAGGRGGSGSRGCSGDRCGASGCRRNNAATFQHKLCHVLQEKEVVLAKIVGVEVQPAGVSVGVVVDGDALDKSWAEIQTGARSAVLAKSHGWQCVLVRVARPARTSYSTRNTQQTQRIRSDSTSLQFCSLIFTPTAAASFEIVKRFWPRVSHPNSAIASTGLCFRSLNGKLPSQLAENALLARCTFSSTLLTFVTVCHWQPLNVRTSSSTDTLRRHLKTCRFSHSHHHQKWRLRPRLESLSTHSALQRASYGVFTRSSKRPALARVFWIHLLEVCWTFAGSCKHPITFYLHSVCSLHERRNHRETEEHRAYSNILIIPQHTITYSN